MGNFNKDFGRKGGGKPAFMYDAICSKCGRACQVPFKPSGGRPVFCRDCFDKPSASGGGGNASRPMASNFDRPRFDNKQMFDATCAKCGNKCQVPFRPVDGKPVFCSNCFEKKGPMAGSSSGNSDQFKGQFASLNAKLDAILKVLTSAPAAAPKVAKATKKVKVKIVKKPVAKKKK
ncbi:MAG: hypothetical protein HY983_01195 [Candidatus Magasanikbacteria bacterium]|nr:hypothetical protein [Candidatus Magasanikbacteria bacterium]